MGVERSCRCRGYPRTWTRHSRQAGPIESLPEVLVQAPKQQRSPTYASTRPPMPTSRQSGCRAQLKSGCRGDCLSSSTRPASSQFHAVVVVLAAAPPSSSTVVDFWFSIVLLLEKNASLVPSYGPSTYLSLFVLALMFAHIIINWVTPAYLNDCWRYTCFQQ